MSENKSVLANIEEATIFSLTEKVKDDTMKSSSIIKGIVKLEYYESILTDSIHARVSYVDSGTTLEDGKSIWESLKIVGGEPFYLKFSDGTKENNELEFEGDYALCINKPSNIFNDTRKGVYEFHLTTKEYELNETTRVNKRYDGLISNSIKSILIDDDCLASKKNIVEIDQTQQYSFFGSNRKPFYIINSLSKKSVSGEHQKEDRSAGYLFFETSEGYHFVSIDGLFKKANLAEDEGNIKKIYYNETGIVPEGYNAKALTYDNSGGINVKSKLSSGTYNTRTITFDPFNCYYRVVTPSSKEIETDKDKPYIKGGNSLPNTDHFITPEKNNKRFSKTQWFCLDTGVMNHDNTDPQNHNFNYGKISNQANMRYNQLFSTFINIIINGDFSLHAGDPVIFDSPSVNSFRTDDDNEQSGGLYIICSLCHWIENENAYTQLTLVRDSFGKDKEN